MDVFLYVVFWGALLYGWVYAVRWLLRKDIAEWRMDREARRARKTAEAQAPGIADEAERFLRGEP